MFLKFNFIAFSIAKQRFLAYTSSHLPLTNFSLLALCTFINVFMVGYILHTE